MQLSRKASFAFVSAGVILILVAILVTVALQARNRPDKLLARFVANPVPRSVKILDSDFVSGREWRAFFHVQVSPQDFSAIFGAKQYKRLQQNSTAYKAFIETTYQRFRSRLPTESALAFYELYEVWSDSDGTVSYLIANPEHSELFAFSARL